MRSKLDILKISLLALAMGVSPMANAYMTAHGASVAGSGYVDSGPGVGLSAGSGAASQDSSSYPEVPGASIDAYAYMSTGGTAQGAMTIDGTVPEGCIDSVLMDVEDPIVQNEEVYTYDIMVEDINALSKAYSKRLKVRTIGKSADGRDLYELIIGNEGAATHVLIDAAIHGREYITSNLCMRQVEYLLHFYDEGSYDGKPLKPWFDNVCLHVVPMVDPDGVSISQFGLSGIRSSELQATIQKAYQDDTAQGYTSYDFDTYLRRWKANARGVNLNQNFDAMFDQAPGTSTLPSAEDYRGAYAASEPETKALTELYDSRVWRAVVNYHAQGRIIYWDIENNKMREHSRDLSNNLMLLTGYQKAIAGGGGGFKEYVQLCSRPAASVTIEVGLGTCPLPGSQMESIWAQNKFVPLMTMKWAYDKFVVNNDR